jgi:hypothetical protein
LISVRVKFSNIQLTSPFFLSSTANADDPVAPALRVAVAVPLRTAAAYWMPRVRGA